jgi:hypothetical protein
MAQFAIQAAIMVASALYQRHQQKKMERDADKNKGLMIPTRGEAAYVPIVYGKAALGGMETRHLTSKTITNYSSNADSTFNYELPKDTYTASDNEFLCIQSALCQGEIGGVQFVMIDDKPYNMRNSKFLHRIEAHHHGGTACNMARANGHLSTDSFTGCSHVTSLYKYKRKDPGYRGTPKPTYFIKGRKIRTINSNLTLGGRVYSNNPALVLLDYLMDPDYGRGLPVSKIDLFSFRRSAQICDTTVASNVVLGGRVNGQLPIQGYNNKGQFPNEGDEEVIYHDMSAGSNNGYYKWEPDDPNDEENTKGEYVLTTIKTRNLPLYECNISLDSEAKIRDNIERILNTMGLAELVWSSSGQYKLLLEYPDKDDNIENLVVAKHIFTDDQLVRSELNINYMSANERLNQATVNFYNEHEDFKSDSVTWPETGSSVHNQFLAEDNQQPFTNSATLDGITDPYHALAKAEQMVRMAREMKSIKFKVSKVALGLEPGDFFKVVSDISDLDEVYRATKVSVREDLTVEVEGYLFNKNMLAWNVPDNVAYAVRPKYNWVIPPVTNLLTYIGWDLNPDGTANKVPYLHVQWDHPGSYQFEIEYKDTRLPQAGWQSIITRLMVYRIYGINPKASYNVRVKAISAMGSPSKNTQVDHQNGQDTQPPGVPQNLEATGKFERILLEWENPPQLDFIYTEIWESSTGRLEDAKLIEGQVQSDYYERANLGISETWYYWVRAVDVAGNKSGYSNRAKAETTFIDDEDFVNNIKDLFSEQGMHMIEDVDSLPETGTPGMQVFNREDGKLWSWAQAKLPIDENNNNPDLVDPNSEYMWRLNITGVNIDDINGKVEADHIMANTITGGLIAASGVITKSAQIENALIKNVHITNAYADRLDARKINAFHVNTGLLETNRIMLNQVTMDTDSAGYITVASKGIDTFQIRPSAVTSVGSTYRNSAVNVDHRGWNLVTSFSVNCVGGKPVLVGSTCTLRAMSVGFNPEVGTTGYQLRWNNSAILSGGGSGEFSSTRLVSSGGGNNSLALYATAYRVWDTSYSQVSKISLWAMELKK